MGRHNVVTNHSVYIQRLSQARVLHLETRHASRRGDHICGILPKWRAIAIVFEDLMPPAPTTAETFVQKRYANSFMGMECREAIALIGPGAIRTASTGLTSVNSVNDGPYRLDPNVRTLQRVSTVVSARHLRGNLLR
jgi:hypothetical protein